MKKEKNDLKNGIPLLSLGLALNKYAALDNHIFLNLGFIINKIGIISYMYTYLPGKIKME